MLERPRQQNPEITAYGREHELKPTFLEADPSKHSTTHVLPFTRVESTAGTFCAQFNMSQRSQSLCLEPPDLNFFKALPTHLELDFGTCKQNRHKDAER